jgi:hypothetical protein
MEKKNYRKPDMRVVKLKYHSHLLAGSPTPGGPDGDGARSHRMNDDE